MRTVGGQSEAGRLVAVAVKPVRDAFHSDRALERQWRALGYVARPALSAAVAEYARFLALLEAAAVEVVSLPAPQTDGPASPYAPDAGHRRGRGARPRHTTNPQRARH